ncbi:MAG: hypothetical protein JWQ85_4331 [Mucilaginibacter sp.]|nr:hypothetical protein [Mucilaginibacter sp.]
MSIRLYIETETWESYGVFYRGYGLQELLGL